MVRAFTALVLALWLLACGGAQSGAKDAHLAAAREAGEDSNDPDVVGEWLLAELVASGGDLKRAAAARKRLESLPPGGVSANIARALDHDIHGRFGPAAEAYLAALVALRETDQPDADLLGWFAASRIGALRHAVPKLWPRAKKFVQQSLRAPGVLGWRARGELVDWWSQERFSESGGATSQALLDDMASRHGCVREAQMAGPFGRGLKGDHRVHFAAEKPAPWPARFPRDTRTDRRAEVRAVDRHACMLIASDAPAAGVYYVQTFVELDAPRDVIIAVQGAYALFVDDVEVLTRDLGTFGVWPRFAVRLSLGAGRHRVLARLMAPETAIRMMTPHGLPLGVRGSRDDSVPYTLSTPKRRADPNALEPFLRRIGVPLQPGASREAKSYDTDHPVRRYLASYLAHIDGQADVASVLLEPVVSDAARATPASLAQQAVFVDGDPIFPQGVARDMARDLRQRAARKDRDLWGPRLWLVLERAEKAGPEETVSDMEELARRFPSVPLVLKRLANMYAQLGWTVEHGRTVERAAAAFPEDTEVLKALLELHEQRGKLKEADAVAERIRRIDPTEEVAFRRALQRRDYQAAIAELKRIGGLRKDRRDIAVRIADLLARAGHKGESLEKLELALRRDPTDAQARLALADARFAAGNPGALTNALAEAIRTHADDSELRSAIELVEGMTDLEPYRRDGVKWIKEVEASGAKLPGHAARVLDYAALWVAPDGSARMLEHEIIRVQSREGIAKHAEQQVPRGIVLRMRTIKSDGRIFEPELVSGKPTVTMPHLEVGDYIETESIWMLRGAVAGGRMFRSPRWYFREENVSYHLSEFVVVVPANRTLVVETTGKVPAPTIERGPGMTVHRWKVTGSPALPEEPFSAPIQEFLPSVRTGWGVDLDSQLRLLMDAAAIDTVRDPRMVRIASTIVRGKLAKGERVHSMDERARRIYRWVLDTIQAGEERDGPKIITGKSGDRMVAFLYLCRLLGIDARLGAVRDRLSPPALGPFSEAEAFDTPAVRIAAGKSSRWLIVQDRYAPYGYLPSSLRGQPAVLLQTEQPLVSNEPPPLERENTSTEGVESSIVHRATGTLREDGAADLSLAQAYHGRYAIQLRSALSNVPESRRKDEVEAKLLGLALPGGRLQDLELPNLDRLDEPVELKMRVAIPSFARPAERELVLDVPFLGSLEPLVQLPERQTPLYISERVATRARVSFSLTLPEGARVVTPLAPVKIDDDRLHVHVADRVEGRVLHVSRELDLPAGRVQPERYAEFRQRVLRASEALNRSLRIALR